MRRALILVALLVTAACSAAPAASTGLTGSTAGSVPPSAAATPRPTGTPRPTAAPATPTPALSFKAGDWPADWQIWICSARAQLLREDAQAGGMAGQDAATRAIADLRKAPNWDPGSDLRALLGKAGFVMLDASPRGGDALKDIVDANAAFEQAYEELRAATGFECPR
jgi:hypothetical protein